MQGQLDGPGHVLDVGEVAPLAAIAVDGDGLAGLDPPLEALQGKIGPLTWPQTEKNRRAKKSRPYWRA